MHGCNLCNFQDGQYTYIDDLIQLESLTSLGAVHLHHFCSRITTPLRAEAWNFRLRNCPDKKFAEYIVQGIKEGFHIDVDRYLACRSSSRNMKSVNDHPAVVEEYLAREIALGRSLCLRNTEASMLPEFISSPIGVIPKRNWPNKWRLIVDLSSPKGASVNDGIDGALCSLTYASVSDAVKILTPLGRGALMAKLDLHEAYRMVPVNPQDRSLLGMRWRGETFIDCTLPFGLHSAPKIFSALADGLLWMIHDEGFALSLHYLDDFLFVGPPNSPYCQQALSTALKLCDELGVQVAMERLEGPTSSLTIEIDSCKQELCLPQGKLRDLRVQLSTWMPRHQGKPAAFRFPRRTGSKRNIT